MTGPITRPWASEQLVTVATGWVRSLGVSTVVLSELNGQTLDISTHPDGVIRPLEEA